MGDNCWYCQFCYIFVSLEKSVHGWLQCNTVAKSLYCSRVFDFCCKRALEGRCILETMKMTNKFSTFNYKLQAVDITTGR